MLYCRVSPPDMSVSGVCLQLEVLPLLSETDTSRAWGESPELRRCREVSDQQRAPRVLVKVNTNPSLFLYTVTQV